MTTILAQLSVERFGWVLVHSLWQFLAIGLAVRLCERAFTGRSGASARYVAGLCGLAAMTAAPFATWFLMPVTPAASAVLAPPVSSADRPDGPNTSVTDVSAMTHPAPPARRGSDQPLAAATSFRNRLHTAGTTLSTWLRPRLPIVVVCWLIGMVCCSLRPVIGWYTLFRLRTVGVSAVGPILEGAVRGLAARLGVTQTVSVFGSALAKTPLVVGYLRPVMLLPVRMVTQLSVADLEAILAHELAHIRRGDFLVNVWQTLLETVFFYHPAVWSLSHRLRAEREYCCDDLALMVIGDPVGYARALLHVEELRGSEMQLALGAGGGSLTDRVQRLFGQPSLPINAAGLMAGVLLPSLTVVSLVTALAWASPPREEGQEPQPKSKSVPRAPDLAAAAPAARSLDIVIAQHVIVWDNRIRTWDEAVTELRELRNARGKPIHANFYFTNGAHSAGRWETHQAKVFEIYKELFEPAGVSLGSISPRAAPRYDVLRNAEDLAIDPKSMRSGVVVENGQPKAGVLVVLVPETGIMPVVLKPDLTLRDPLDEVWTTTGPDGRFTLPVQPVHSLDKLAEPPTYSIAAISPAAYRLVSMPAEGAETKIELLPLARVELTPVGGQPQQLGIALHGGLSDTSPGFIIYEIELRDKVIPLDLPAGKITIRQTFKKNDGSSRSYPVEVMRVGPGVSWTIKLPNLTEQEAERKWIEDSLRPKGNAGASKPN